MCKELKINHAFEIMALVNREIKWLWSNELVVLGLNSIVCVSSRDDDDIAGGSLHRTSAASTYVTWQSLRMLQARRGEQWTPRPEWTRSIRPASFSMLAMVCEHALVLRPASA